MVFCPRMANLTDKHPRNAAGPYYVDSSCTDCDLCRSLAPDIFIRDDDLGFTFVTRQPQTPDEIACAEAGRTGCPTDSIGNDGGAVD